MTPPRIMKMCYGAHSSGRIRYHVARRDRPGDISWTSAPVCIWRYCVAAPGGLSCKCLISITSPILAPLAKKDCGCLWTT